MELCPYCLNRSSDVCIPCKEEGRYRFLEADTLNSWELPPELPKMRELLEMPPDERLAVLWLSARFAEREKMKGELWRSQRSLLRRLSPKHMRHTQKRLHHPRPLSLRIEYCYLVLEHLFRSWYKINVRHIVEQLAKNQEHPFRCMKESNQNPVTVTGGGDFSF